MTLIESFGKRGKTLQRLDTVLQYFRTVTIYYLAKKKKYDIQYNLNIKLELGSIHHL